MSFIKEWEHLTPVQHRKALKSIIESDDYQRLQQFIDYIKAPDKWGVYASYGQHFTLAIFGRDSLTVAEDLLDIDRMLVQEILLVMARLQGIESNHINEEEPGKIHHEFRMKHFVSHSENPDALFTLVGEQLAWGGVGSSETIYYGSYDATLLFIKVLCNYVLRYGQEILQEKIVGRNNKKKTMKDCLRAAVLWMVAKIEQSPLQLFEFKRLNPKGYLNQSWKDSLTAYIREDGTMPNYNHGIASIELQGNAYDALLLAVKFAAASDQEAKDWSTLAKKLQASTLKHFWMPHSRYFAEGIEYTDHGKPRQIKTLTSNAGVLLDSNILIDLPEIRRRKYVKSVAQYICGPEFLTPVGIRCRARRYAKILDYIDYHGAFTVWPRETNAIIKGLQRQGLHLLADRLSDLQLASFVYSGTFPEYYFVEMNDTVWYDQNLAKDYLQARYATENLPTPDPYQAWSLSAAIRLSFERSKIKDTVPIHTWEQKIVHELPKKSDLMQFI